MEGDMSRVPLLAPEDMTEAQRAVRDAIAAGPRGPSAFGPFNAWLQSPEFANRAQELGALLRFGTSIEPRLKELAILCVGRWWTAQFEWYAHKKLALEAGLSAAVIDALEARARPEFGNEDEAVVYDFAQELLARRDVSDARYAAAEALLGRAGVVELVGVLGYYTLVSMTLNVFRAPLPEGISPPLAP